MKVIGLLTVLVISTSASAGTQYDLIKTNFDSAQELISYEEMPVLNDTGRSPMKCVAVYKTEPNARYQADLGRYEKHTDPSDPLQTPTTFTFLAGPHLNRRAIELDDRDLFTSTQTKLADGGKSLLTRHRSQWREGRRNGLETKNGTMRVDLWARKSSRGFYPFKVHSYVKYTYYSTDPQDSGWGNHERSEDIYGYCWN